MSNAPQFARFLQQCLKQGPTRPSPEELTHQLRKALVTAADTNENVVAAQRLAVKKFHVGTNPLVGPVVLPNGASIASLLWCLEETTGVPAAVKRAYPQLQKEEWRAALRFTIRVLAELDAPLDS